MKKIVDLSHPITHQMSVFPGDPAVGVLRHHDYKNGYFVSQIIMGTHTGTHIDVPAHKIKGEKTVDQVLIEKFTGTALVMDLTDLKPMEEITSEKLKTFEADVKDVDAVIVKTGWSKHFGKEDFFTAFPGFDESGVQWLIDHKIRLIGLESPSVNPTDHQKIHTLLLEREIVIVESLTNVEALTKDVVEFFAVPLKLKGLDGSPVRAFAIE